MKVILTQNVARLGNKGDVVEVSEGYARNYLIKNNLAKEASASAIKENQKLNKQKEAKKEKILKKKFEFVKTYSENPLQIALPANENGHLFEKLDKKKLIKTIEKEGVSFTEKEIMLDLPIKELGIYDLRLNLNSKKLQLKIEVTRAD